MWKDDHMGTTSTDYNDRQRSCLCTGPEQDKVDFNQTATHLGHDSPTVPPIDYNTFLTFFSDSAYENNI